MVCSRGARPQPVPREERFGRSEPEVYHDWTFAERFPGHEELRSYVAHIDKTLGLRKDTIFHAKVNDASWDQHKGEWTVRTEQGHTASSKYLILA